MADPSRTSRAGFTLIELLVALAVFSLAALALLNLSGENTRSAARVEAMIDPRLAEGRTNGAVPLAGRQWRWSRTVEGVEAGLLRIDIAVATDEDQAADRVLFRARPS